MLNLGLTEARGFRDTLRVLSWSLSMGPFEGDPLSTPYIPYTN